MTDLIGKMFERINSGEIPTERDKVEDCVLHVAFAILNLWSTNGQHGGEQLSFEIDALITALKNKNDPIVKTLNVLDRTMLFSSLNVLTKGKEAAVNAQAKAEAEATECNSDSTDNPNPTA